MNLSKIALRNLSRQKKRSFLLAGAIAFGVFIVVLVNAFSTGTVRIVKENFSELMGGHVFVTLQHREGDKTISLIEDESKLLKVIDSLGLKEEDITRVTDMQQADLIYGGQTEIQGIIGVDWTSQSALAKSLGVSAEVYERLKNGAQGIVLSKKMAEKLKVSQGDVVMVRGRTITGQQNVGEIEVAFVNGDTSDTSSFFSFASKPFVNAMLNLSDPADYRALHIRLASLDLAEDFALKLKEALKQYYPIAEKDREQPGMDSNVFRMSDSDKSDFVGERADVTTINEFLTQITQLSGGLQLVSIVVLVILLLITMVGIANTFRMILFERVREIGTMRAVGMYQRHVGRLFLLEALFLALVGVGIGTVVSLLAMVLLGLIDFGTESFFSVFLQNGHLKFQIDPIYFGITIVLVSLLTLLAARGPARKASKLHPADALRTSY